MTWSSSPRNRLRITLALAGFAEEDLEVQVEDHQLVIRGKQGDDKTRTYLHRGIAARQFQRSFVLAEGIEVVGATLEKGPAAHRPGAPRRQAGGAYHQDRQPGPATGSARGADRR